MPEPIKLDNQTPDADDKNTPPTTLKVGDKEYTPEEIEKLEANRDFFQTESQKAKDENKTLAEKAQAYDELQSKADKVIEGDVSASDLTAQELDDLKYMSKIGFVPKSKFDEVLKMVDEKIAKAKEEAKSEVEGNLTKKEKATQVRQELTALKEQHPFIEQDKVEQYLSDRAEGKNGLLPGLLTPREAVMILYPDQILANKEKPIDLPGVESSKKGIPDEPKPKILPLGSKAMSERIAERLVKVD